MVSVIPAPTLFKSEDSPPLRWGVVGAGGIAETMTRTVQRSSRQEFVAVASRTPDKAKDFAGKLGLSAFYSSYEELIDRDDIDVVYTANFPSSHREVALFAISAGKPMLIEKPIALDSISAAEIYIAANKKMF